MKNLLALGITLAVAPVLVAQGKWQQEFAKHLKVAKDFTIAVAEQMPEDSYDFKPNPEEMGFGALMVHIALPQAGACARVAGEKSPLTKPEKIDKAAALKALNDAFDYCLKVVPNLTEEQLDKNLGKPGGPEMSGREALWAYFTHTAHHRGQAEVYLRVKNIKPPQYRF